MRLQNEYLPGRNRLRIESHVVTAHLAHDFSLLARLEVRDKNLWGMLHFFKFFEQQRGT